MTTDQIFTAKNMIEKAWKYNVGLYQIFVDFQTVSDSMQRGKFLSIMESYEISGRFDKLTKVKTKNSMYDIKMSDIINVF